MNSSQPTFASVISNRGFRFLWLNQVLVQVAYNTLNFALIIWVFKLVDSNLAVSGLLLAIYLPVILFGLFAGVFVDFSDRRKIILTIDLALALTFFVFIFIKHSYPLILINTFIVNTLAQFFLPSESSSIPMLLSRKQLFVANSLFTLTLYGSFLVGVTAGGPILNHLGINAVFIGGSLSLLVAFLLAHNLPVIAATKISQIGHLFSLKSLKIVLSSTQGEIKQTVGFIKGRLNIVSSIILMALVQGVIGILAAIMPSYMERVLKIHATDSSYFVMLPLGTGMVLGAILVGRMFYNRPKRSLVIPAVVIAGILFLLGGVAPVIAQLFNSADLPANLVRPRYFFRAPSLSSFFSTIAFLLGFCMVAIMIPCQTVLQENTPEKLRGKIFAVLAVIMTSFSAAPVILAGGMADLFGTTPVFITLGVVTFFMGLLASRPSWFFEKGHLPFRVREFLGLGHWERS